MLQINANTVIALINESRTVLGIMRFKKKVIPISDKVTCMAPSQTEVVKKRSFGLWIMVSGL